jgi:short-subunit dehydrogenase
VTVLAFYGEAPEPSLCFMLSPKEAAAIIIKGMEHKKYQVLAGNDAKIMDFLHRLNPKKATDIIAKKIKTL